MKDVNCHACSKVMFKTEHMGKGQHGLSSKEEPLYVRVDGTEYIKCPHCEALHTILESDSPVGGSSTRIIGLKK